MAFVSPAEIEGLAKKIEPFIRQTPLEHGSGPLAELLLKREDLQETNSFTVRAALGIMMHLSPAQIEHGLVLTTPGNLGWGLVHALHRLQGIGHLPKMRLTIVLPEDAVEAKRLGLDDIQHPDITVVRSGFSEEERYGIVREISRQEGLLELSLENRRSEVAAKGTIAFEILKQLASGKFANDELTFYCPIGSGALAAGCAVYFKEKLGSRIRIVGVEPKSANDFSMLFHKKQISSVRAPMTVADSLRSPQVRNEYRETLLSLVDDVVEVDEAKILEAMTILYQNGRIVSEPSSAIAVAGYLKSVKKSVTQIAVLTAANVDFSEYDFYRQS